jgi:hypothetical protein
MELALPIISKDKIFKKVDFGFIKSIGTEFISRFNDTMFSSNTMGKKVEKKKERELKEDYLFR